jgi:hypothetical protein
MLLLAPKPCTRLSLVPLPKSASNNLRKWFLSPTGSIKPWFHTERKLTVVLIIPSSWGFPTGPVRHQIVIQNMSMHTIWSLSQFLYKLHEYAHVLHFSQPNIAIRVTDVLTNIYTISRPPLKTKQQASYQLWFVNKACKEYYIWGKIKAEDGGLLKVALYNEDSLRITSGPLSSASVEIILLHGDFNADGQDYWSPE